MKHTLYLFIIFFLLGFCDCKEKTYPRCLLVADSLVNTNPDSAISLLCSIKEDMLVQSEEIQMYYHLLCIKADDKAYISLKSDSLILSILHYYIEKNDSRHLPEAYYYAGRTYRSLGDAPQALNYFDKALEVLGSDSCCELRSLLNSQMGYIFFDQGIWDEARKVYAQAYRWSALKKDSVSMVYDLRDIASTYSDAGVMDSSLIFYQKAYDLACNLKNHRLMNMVQSQIARVYKKTGEYDLAKKALQSSLAAVDDRTKSAVYSIAADIHYKMGEKDSAFYYYNELLDFGGLHAKTDAYWHLAEFALEEGQAQKAKEYLEQYIAGIDSVWKLTDTETIRKMHAHYNYTLRERENDQLKAENKQDKFYLECFAVGSVVVLLCFIAYFQYSRRKHAQLKLQLIQLEQIKEEQYQKSILFIEENRRMQEKLEHALLENSRSELQKEQMEKQKELLYYTGKRAELGLQEREQARKVLLESDICNLFKGACRDSLESQVSGEDWSLLEEAVNGAYGGLIGKLYKIHKLNEREVRICLLIKIGILPKDMAKLTNYSRESISSVRRRLYEKFFGEKGTPQQWDEFIDSL